MDAVGTVLSGEIECVVSVLTCKLLNIVAIPHDVCFQKKKNISAN